MPWTIKWGRHLASRHNWGWLRACSWYTRNYIVVYPSTRPDPTPGERASLTVFGTSSLRRRTCTDTRTRIDSHGKVYILARLSCRRFEQQWFNHTKTAAVIIKHFPYLGISLQNILKVHSPVIVLLPRRSPLCWFVYKTSAIFRMNAVKIYLRVHLFHIYSW